MNGLFRKSTLPGLCLSLTRRWGMPLAVTGAIVLSGGGALAASTAPTEARPPPAPTEAESNQALVVDLSVGESGLDPSAVRAGIARELGVLVAEPSPTAESRSKLEVRLEQPDRAEVRFLMPDGRSVGRSIDLPHQSERAVETIALLAANLVRNEATDLIVELERRARAAAAIEAPAEEQPEPKHRASRTPQPPAPKSSDQPSRDLSREPSDEVLLDRHLINLSLFHPVALYPDSERRAFQLELGLLYGRVGAIDGATLNAGLARIDQRLHGVQLAGVGSSVGRDSAGAQIAGLGVHVGGDSTGAQIAGVGVLSEGCSHGVHLSGLVNLELGRSRSRSGAEPCRGAALVGAQITGGYNSVTGDLLGAQTSGGVNSVAGNLDGLQVSGVVNIVTGSARGGQVSSVNVTTGNLVGAGVGVLNVVASGAPRSPSRGVEIGVTNVDRSELDGLQVGVVNVSGKQRGVQIGVVNVAEHLDGVPVGLVNVGGNTDTSMLLFSTSRTPANLGAKFLTGHVFSTISGGCDRGSFLDGPCQHVLQGAWTFGGHLPLAETFALEPSFGYAYEADVERPAESVNGGHVVLYRAALSWQPFAEFGLFAGAGARQLIDHQGHVMVQGELLGGIQAF